MSLIPEFELGLWNAWILVIPMLIIFFFNVRATAARESGESGDFQLSRKEKIIMNAVFLPLQLGTWLYSGLLIYLFGMVFIIVALLNLATSPRKKTHH